MSFCSLACLPVKQILSLKWRHYAVSKRAYVFSNSLSYLRPGILGLSLKLVVDFDVLIYSRY